MQFSINESISQVQIPENFFFPCTMTAKDTSYDTKSIIVHRSYRQICYTYRNQLKNGTSSAVSRSYYFTSEQLFGPTGSLKQLDIAITAASIDTSSPCFTYQIHTRLKTSKSPRYKSMKKENQQFYLFFPIKHVSICPCQTAPEATWNIEIHSSSNIEVQYVS